MPLPTPPLLAAAGLMLPEHVIGHVYFESLFWGGGHLWQFALVTLLMVCWIELALPAARRLPAGVLTTIIATGALPVLAALSIAIRFRPDTTEYVGAFTWLMQWTSWEAPLIMAFILFWRTPRRDLAPGFGLSVLLFVAGLLLGSLINGQTTLVTAHYHGTIGAVTLGFMAASFTLLPRLGISAPSACISSGARPAPWSKPRSPVMRPWTMSWVPARARA